MHTTVKSVNDYKNPVLHMLIKNMKDLLATIPLWKLWSYNDKVWEKEPATL